MRTLQHGYADSTVICDLELTCAACGNRFWFTAGEQDYFAERGLVQPRRCKACRDARKNGNGQHAPMSSTALVPASASDSLPTIRDVQLPKLPKVFTNKKALFGDIEQLLYEASEPIDYEGPTFTEWLRGIDPVAEQMAHKMWAARSADEMVQQRTALFNHIRQMIDAAAGAELARIEAQLKIRQAQLLNRQLEEAIENHEAMKDQRFGREQLQEAIRHKELQDKLLPPVEEKSDPAEVFASETRGRARVRAKVKADLFSDCLNEMRRLYRSRLERSEKAARMRIVMEEYRVELDTLPKYMSTFLERAEDAEYE